MQPADRADVTRVLRAVEALAPQIKAAADTIEAGRRLPPALARALMEAGVFRMGAPRVYGGGEFDPEEPFF
jgi:alkylation response protein AidB-like acyl-CoA dehydrogenase